MDFVICCTALFLDFPTALFQIFSHLINSMHALGFVFFSFKKVQGKSFPIRWSHLGPGWKQAQPFLPGILHLLVLSCDIHREYKFADWCISEFEASWEFQTFLTKVCFKKQVWVLFSFGIWPILMLSWVIYFTGSAFRDLKLGVREMKERVKLYQRQNQI